MRPPAALLDALRTGRWLTPQRRRVYAVALLVAYGLALALLLATGNGLVDYAGRPLGTDFGQVWTAGLNALRGHAAESFDIHAHHARQQAEFGAGVPVFGWHYPPLFLLVAAPLALLPYLAALALWQAATLAGYLATLWRILPSRDALLAAVAFPAVFVNLGHGHNGFFTTLLLGAGLLLLDRRPALAGIAIGLLAYKLQFGMVIAVALLAGQRWRAIAAAAATVAATAALTLALFGLGTWQAFFDNLGFTRSVILEQGATGWPRLQSLFAAIRLWGGGLGLAYAGQAAFTGLVLAAVAWAWRSRADARLRRALVPVASLLATPYVLDYDMVLLALSIAFYLAWARENGLRPWDVTLLATVWMVPLVARLVAAAILLPVGLLAMLALAAMILGRAVADHRAAAGVTPAAAPATG